MTRQTTLFVFGIVFVGSTMSLGESVPSRMQHGEKSLALGSHTAWQAVENVKPGQRAQVIVSGDGSSYLGLYVYDRHGNCVAWDDEVNPRSTDDLVGQWSATVAGAYTVEVRNLSAVKNKVQYAVTTSPSEPRGEVPGKMPEGQVHPLKDAAPFVFRPTLEARGQLSFRKPFAGGGRASVTVIGDHHPPVRIDVEVYDDQGKRVARDSCIDFCAAVWYPPRDAEYTITIRNYGDVHNKCTVALR